MAVWCKAGVLCAEAAAGVLCAEASANKEEDEEAIVEHKGAEQEVSLQLR